MEEWATDPSRANLMWRLCVGSLSECVVLVEFNHELQLFIIACLCLGVAKIVRAAPRKMRFFQAP